MTHTAVPERAGPLRPQPPVPAQVARCGQVTVRQMPAEHERHRLARELHDGVIQEILAAGLAIELCLADVPAGSPVRAGLEQARRLTASAVRRLRSSLRDLREGPTAPEDELPELLRRLAVRHPAPRLEVSVEVTGPAVPLAAAVRWSLFQMASECVFNAAVHGRARRAVVRLGYGPAGITLGVADDGHGDPEVLGRIIRREVPGTGGGYHLGLADIAARAEEMGWALTAGRSDLGGIAIQVALGPGQPGGGREGATGE